MDFKDIRNIIPTQVRSIGSRIPFIKNILSILIKILPHTLLVSFSGIKLYINPQDLRNFTSWLLPTKYINLTNKAFYSLLDGNVGLFAILGSKKGMGVGGYFI